MSESDQVGAPGLPEPVLPPAVVFSTGAAGFKRSVRKTSRPGAWAYTADPSSDLAGSCPPGQSLHEYVKKHSDPEMVGHLLATLVILPTDNRCVGPMTGEIMASSYELLLDQALADYAEQRARVGEIYQQMADLSETTTAPRQVVRATVGAQGELRDLAFPTAAFKNMTGTELAAVILKTVSQAQAQMRSRSASVLAPGLPPGLSAEDLVSGRVDLHQLLPDRPTAADVGAKDGSY